MKKWFESVDEEDVTFVGFAAALLLGFISFVVIWYVQVHQLA
jgi:hypothetical protein